MGTHLESQCLSCGRDTSAGTTLFASRKRGLDRERNVEGFLCYACQGGTATLGAEQSIPLSGRYVVIDIPGGMAGY
jgi:hypothetical protein